MINLKKILCGIALSLIILGLFLYFIFKVTSIGYEQSSLESIEKYNTTVEFAKNLDCPKDGLTETFVEQLRKKYPNKLIDLKGNDLIIDRFLFRCMEDETGNFFFKTLLGSHEVTVGSKRIKRKNQKGSALKESRNQEGTALDTGQDYIVPFGAQD